MTFHVFPLRQGHEPVDATGPPGDVEPVGPMKSEGDGEIEKYSAAEISFHFPSPNTRTFP
jgi:hypothetical protein